VVMIVRVVCRCRMMVMGILSSRIKFELSVMSSV